MYNWQIDALPFEGVEVAKSTASRDTDHHEHQRYANRIAYWALLKLREANPQRKDAEFPLLFHYMGRMPLDIIFSILDNLHPIDLYHLTRANKTLRSLLMSHSSISCWKNSYQQTPLLPPCPPGISEPRWAHLLFGRLRCDVCDKPTETTDFGLGSRFCDTCALERLISPDDCGETGLGLNWDFLPKSHPYLGNGEPELDSPDQFLKEDVVKAAAEVRVHMEAVDNGVEGAEDAFEAYKTRHRELAKVRSEAITRLNKAFRWITEELQVIDDKTADRLRKQLIKRFRYEGFTDGDYSDASYNFSLTELGFNRYKRVTNKVWLRARISIEHHLIESRKDRFERERADVLTARRAVVNKVYGQYRERCLPATWAYQPPGYTVQAFEPFKTLIDDPSARPITEKDCAAGVAQLPKLVEEWTFQKINQLAGLLPEYQRSQPKQQVTSKAEEEPCCSPPPSSPSSSTSSSSSLTVSPPKPDVRDLDLATAVFHCLGSSRSTTMSGRCLIGWEGAGSHLRCGALRSYYEGRVHFNERGYDAAVALVELLGLDPKMALARDLDKLPVRFLCANCNPADGGFKAYTWRECVLHHLDCVLEGTHSAQTKPSWVLLTPEAAADVIRRERPSPLITDPSWCCNHCAAHWDVSVTRQEAIKHVRTTHKIKHPIDNIDYIFFASSARTARRPVNFKPHDGANYMCKRCKNSQRLYTLRPLTAHLRDKHEVTDPVENEDWKYVEKTLRSTASMLAASSSGEASGPHPAGSGTTL